MGRKKRKNPKHDGETGPVRSEQLNTAASQKTRGQNKERANNALSPGWVKAGVYFAGAALVITIAVGFIAWWTYKGQRAWIMVDSAGASAPVVPGIPIRFALVYKNTGGSPALGVHAKLGFLVAADGGNHSDQLGYPGMEESVFDLGQGQERTSYVDMPKGISPDTVERIRGGVMSLYFQGILDYPDGAGAMGHTSYCFVWKPPNPTSATERFVRCNRPGHNVVR